VTDDPRIGEQPLHVALTETRHPREVKAGKRPAKRLPLAQDGQP